MKKILITSTDVMMYLFLYPHVEYLLKKKYHVDIACSSPKGFKKEKYEEKLKKKLPKSSNYFYLSAERSPLSVYLNYKAYNQLSKIIKDGNYDLIWTNEPVIGVLTRLASQKYRKKGLKVLYLAHGFHFFKGTPKINWIYYPVERFMSKYCDLMVMINWEDYNLTKKYFKKPVKHINGIGLDIEKFKNINIDSASKRKELDISNTEIVVVSVGELMYHKNHEVIIKALSLLKNKNIKYIICGMGERLQFLKNLSKKFKVENNVKFLGYRNDIGEILLVSDIFAHPSRREGLGIASLEAMTVGLPIITSNVHGLKDYSINNKTGYCLNPGDYKGFAKAINDLSNNKKLRKEMGIHNKRAVEKFSVQNSTNDMELIINELLFKV